jgi:hypothetical protein
MQVHFDASRLAFMQEVTDEREALCRLPIDNALARSASRPIEYRGTSIALRQHKHHGSVLLFPSMAQRAIEMPQVHLNPIVLPENTSASTKLSAARLASQVLPASVSAAVNTHRSSPLVGPSV